MAEPRTRRRPARRPDPRLDEKEGLSLLVIEAMESVHEAVDDVQEDIQRLRKELADNARQTEKALRGFPNDDPDGHRRAHEARIKAAEEYAKLCADVRAHVAKGTVWSLIGGLLLFAWWCITHLPQLLLIKN